MMAKNSCFWPLSEPPWKNILKRDRPSFGLVRLEEFHNQKLIRPEKAWESNARLKLCQSSFAQGRANQLRDPSFVI